MQILSALNELIKECEVVVTLQSTLPLLHSQRINVFEKLSGVVHYGSALKRCGATLYESGKTMDTKGTYLSIFFSVL